MLPPVLPLPLPPLLLAVARRLASRLWDWDLTPGSLVRCMGPWGAKVTHGYCQRRFTRQQQLGPEEAEAFGEYHYHTMAPPGSGEFALRHILAPFAWPRNPLEHRMQHLECPITFL